MLMRKLVFIIMAFLCPFMALAQPRPYEIDTSFIPTLEYMQKTWSGEYDGIEPNSKMILSIKRSLVLYKDLTYVNEVKGHIKEQSEEVLLRYESGKYLYDPEDQSLTYSIDVDSTLDINILLRGEELSYAVNHYQQDGTEKIASEKVQFTYASNDEDRLWVLFDNQLMSPIDQRQKAVYVMGGTIIESSYYYIGEKNGWDITNRDYPFTTHNNGNTWELSMETVNHDMFVIIPSTTTSWDDVVYHGQADGALNGTYTSEYGKGENFFVPATFGMYSYTISINPSTEHYEIVINKYEDSDSVECYYYVGNMNGWDITNRDYPFTKRSNDNIWELTMYTRTDDMFAIIPSTTTSWDDVVYRGQADGALNGTYTSESGKGENFYVPGTPGMHSYTILINPAYERYKIIMNKYEDSDSVECYYYVGTINDWDLHNKDYPFTKRSEDNIWELTMKTETDDMFAIVPSTAKSWEDVICGQADKSLSGTYITESWDSYFYSPTFFLYTCNYGYEILYCINRYVNKIL